MSQTVNQRVAARRKSLGLRQYQVAELMGMKTTAYSQMERTGNITSKRIVELSKILDVTTDYLLFGEELDFNPIEKKDSVMHEPQFFQKEEGFILSTNEKNIITILRNFPKSVREDVIAYIDKKYQETK